jgi:hypothetical protein
MPKTVCSQAAGDYGTKEKSPLTVQEATFS